MPAWTHFGPTVATSFLASLVEFVEALTVVLAVGAVRGWRHALCGAGAALLVLSLLLALFGPSLAALPLPLVQLVIGSLILLFGLRWLRKAILRSAGAIALHDEAQSFRRATAALQSTAARDEPWDAEAFMTAFKIVLLEGVEVVFIVVAIAATQRSPWPAIGGAVAALGLVVGAGILVHRPLARVPENQLKFAVGVLTTAFGTLMVGEALSLHWPGGDGALALIIAVQLVLALALVPLATASRGAAPRPPRPAATARSGALSAILHELTALFIDDPWLAGGAAAWVGLSALALRHFEFSAVAACALFVGGMAVVLAVSVQRAAAATG